MLYFYYLITLTLCGGVWLWCGGYILNRVESLIHSYMLVVNSSESVTVC